MQIVRANNKVFNSISKLAKFLQMPSPTLRRVLNGKQATIYKDILIEKIAKPTKGPNTMKKARGIPVIVDDVPYDNCATAERELGFPINSLTKCLRLGKKSYKGHTVSAVYPSQIKRVPGVHNTKRVNVTCVTTGEVFKSLKDAAQDAQVDSWTISKKMETAGSFISRDGKEYVRERPMVSKNTYKNTGKTLKAIRPYTERPSRRGVKLNTKETFVPIDTALETAKSKREVLFPNATDTKPQVPQVVKDALNDKIIDLLKGAGIYDKIVDLLNYGGFSSIKINK
jgi:hypothetical protein